MTWTINPKPKPSRNSKAATRHERIFFTSCLNFATNMRARVQACKGEQRVRSAECEVQKEKFAD
jgi:hypothetical protein